MTTSRKGDRRVQKTKRALGDALFALMIEKGYEETNVADIVERANVGRSTFYAHYADKDDLLQDGLRGLREHLTDASTAIEAGRNPPHPALTFSLPMLEHVFEVRELFHAIAGKRSGAAVQKHLQIMLGDLVCERLVEAKTPLPGPPELVAEFVVGAFLAICFWWMDGHDELSAAAIDRAFRELAMSGLEPVGSASP